MAPTAQTAADVTQALLAAAMSGGKKRKAEKGAAKPAAKKAKRQTPTAKAAAKAAAKPAAKFPYAVGEATVYKDVAAQRYKVKYDGKERSFSYRGPGEAAAWKTAMAYIADHCL